MVESIFEHRIRQQIDIDDIQFGFMKGKGTTDAIFIVRQMQEKFRDKGKKLYFGFVDLENAFDRESQLMRFFGANWRRERLHFHSRLSHCPSLPVNNIIVTKSCCSGQKVLPVPSRQLTWIRYDF